MEIKKFGYYFNCSLEMFSYARLKRLTEIKCVAKSVQTLCDGVTECMQETASLLSDTLA